MIIRKRNILIILLGFQVFFISLSAQVVEDASPWQKPEKATNYFALFENEDLLEITLSFDIGYYMSAKPDQEDIDAVLTYHITPNDSINLDVGIRARGNYRLRTCSFPPLRINFSGLDLGFDDLKLLNNIKTVSHCDSLPVYEEYMFKEFLVYRLYNVITNYSFRVRLLKINYNDIGESGMSFSNYSFVIEPMNFIADRTSGTELEDVKLDYESLFQPIIDRVSVFQYMIGNRDWDITLMHNLKLIKWYDGETDQIAPIPYDFDYSGFVNTHYAIQANGNSAESIRDRVFVSRCIDDDKLRYILNEFAGKREAFIEIIRNFEYIEKPVRKDLEKYIDSFFDEYKKDLIFENIKKNCITK